MLKYVCILVNYTYLIKSVKHKNFILFTNFMLNFSMFKQFISTLESIMSTDYVLHPRTKFFSPLPLC